MEAYLDACVTSLVRQTYANLEILLIDDGSPDNCPAMCDAWAERDARVRVIHSENHGVSHARNLGLRAATGEYIGFCDSDDWVDLDAYEKMLHAMREEQADICSGGFRVEGEVVHRGNSSQSFAREEAIEVIYSVQPQNAFLTWSLWDKVFSRSVVEGLFFDETMSLSEDQWFLWNIFRRIHKMVYLPLCGYHYRMRPGSAVHTLPDVRKCTYIDAAERIRKDAATLSQRVQSVIEEMYWGVVLGTLRGLLERRQDWGAQTKDIEEFLRHWNICIRQDLPQVLANCHHWRIKALAVYFALPYPFVGSVYGPMKKAWKFCKRMRGRGKE